MTKLEARKRPKTLPPTLPPSVPAPDSPAAPPPQSRSLQRLSSDELSLYETAWTELLMRDDGYLRAVPHECGKITYYKWKFTRGDHGGKYVMYVDKNGRLDESLLGLLDKLRRTDAGAHTPTPDHGYE